MNDLMILHLSDLHIDDNSTSYSRLLKGLLDDIKKEIKYVKDKSVIVVITGDIIHQGKKKAANAAIQFFNDLKEIIIDKVITIYIVPGNHDKFRTKENKFLISTYRALQAQSLESKDTKFNDDFYESFWKFHIDAYKSKKGSGYLELTQKIYKIFGMSDEEIKNKSFIKDTFGVDIVHNQDKKYCFVLLNTAWSSIDDNDNRNLILGGFQIKKIKNQFHNLTDKYSEEDRPDLTIVLGHHPIGCLHGKEEDGIFTEMISFEELDANVYLCGHTHDRTVINWVNNRHSINTFMTGIGWPENGSGYHIGTHTYSMYAFNLDINSIDIYVKSTDDGGSFDYDYRIYNSEQTKDNKKIVFPIQTQKAQTHILLNTGPNRSKKAYYISNEFMEYISEYILRMSRFCYVIGIITESDKNELYENIIYGRELNEQEEFDNDEIMFNYLFANTNEEIDNKEDVIKEILKFNEKNLFDMFLGFLFKICQKLQQILLHEYCNKNDIVRFHFRFLADKNNFLYVKLCTSFSSFSTDINLEDYDVSEIKYGELIEASYNTERGLIYSLNKDLCNNALKDKWKNFITIIPIFEQNHFTRRYSGETKKKFPYITFGVTTNSKKFDNLLYCMDYFSINKTLGEMIEKYLQLFNISIEKFCAWAKNNLKDC